MKPPPVLLLLLLLATLPLHAHAHKKKQPKKIPRPPGTGILEYFPLKGEDKDKDGGVCLDGSPAGYYYREGWGEGATKFLLFYEGGGWCKSDRDCNLRAHTPLGSSKEWLPFMEASSSLGSYFLNTSTNPLFDWNLLFLKYCDGSSFSSFVPGPISVTTRLIDEQTQQPIKATVYYRGQKIHDAFLKTCVKKHCLLEKATDVVVSGCSAGGLAVYLHVDEVAALFKNRPQTRVRGLADSGFFLNVDSSPLVAEIKKRQRNNSSSSSSSTGEGNNCTAAEDLEWLAWRQKAPALHSHDLPCLAAGASGGGGATGTAGAGGGGSGVGRLTPNPKVGNETGGGPDAQNGGFDGAGGGGAAAAAESVLQKNHLRASSSSSSSSSSQSIAAEDQEASTRARCLFARHLLPSLRTPVFSFLSRYDWAQAASFACLPQPEEEVEAQNAVGEMVVKAFKESVESSNVKHGYLIDACARHCFWEQFSPTVSAIISGVGVAHTTTAAGGGGGTAAVPPVAAPAPAAAPAASKEEVVIDAEHPKIINAWTNIKGPSGRTVAEIFMAWYEGEGGVEDWREERVERYPCLECCGG